MKERLIKFHILRTFFESLPKWKEERKLAGIEGNLDQIEYDNLFRGTKADIYVPLWASCLSGMDILLNEETLNVIKTYKKYGYRHVCIDGNPPDYIGEQFRFLEYLYRFNHVSEAQSFIDEYTLDTFREMSIKIREYSQNSELLEVLKLGEDTLAGGDDYRINGDIGKILEEIDSSKWKEEGPIPLSEERVISSASFSDCGIKCKMLTTVQEGCILRVNPDVDCGFSGCPRGAAYRQSFLNSRRLRYPMERIGERGEGRFKRISWEEAEEKLLNIIKESHNYGPSSRYVMAGAGVTNGLQNRDLLKKLLALDGGLLGYYNTYSVGAAIPVMTKMFGSLMVFNQEEEILKTDLLILWGHNLVTTHFGLEQKKLLMKAKEKGIEIIVIDPRQSDTVIATEGQWIPIRPGTDAALASAINYVLVEEDYYDKKFLDKYCLGFDENTLPEGVPSKESYLSYLNGEKDGIKKTPLWASEITGIPEATIYELARKIGETKKVLFVPGLGMQRTLSGEQNYRSILLIPCVLGNIHKEGCGLVSWIRPEEPKPQMRGFDNPCKIQVPVFNWWRAVECPETLNEKNGLLGTERLEEPVRYIFSIASGMLMSQHSNINHTLSMLRKDSVKAVVLSDIFMTPSVKVADLVFPAPSFFETDNFNLPWVSDDYFLFNNHAINPLFETKLELEWIIKLAEGLGLKDEFTMGKEKLNDWLKEMWDDFKSEDMPSFEEFKKTSYMSCKYKGDPLTLKRNIEEDIAFDTPSGRIEIFLKEAYDRKIDSFSIPQYVSMEEGLDDVNRDNYPLQLIGYRTKRKCHSMYDKTPWLVELESHRLWINKNDAGKRNIEDGDEVLVYNYRGMVRIKAFVTDRIMEGVCSMGDGAWFEPDSKGTDKGGAINTLTMDHRSLPIGHGNPQHTNLVEIEKA